MNQLIAEVLCTANGGSAPEMSRALAKLGGDDMGAGIRALWKSGNKTGFVFGSVLSGIAAVVGTGIYAWKKLRAQERRHIQNLTAIYDAGKAAALRELEQNDIDADSSPKIAEQTA